MWSRLSLITAPAPALSVDQVREELRIDHFHEDVKIAEMIDAAAGLIDGPDGIGFAMMAQVWRLALDRFPPAIRLPLRPVVSVDAVRYDTVEGEQTLDAAAYHVALIGGAAAITPVTGWPSHECRPGAVRVDFTAGEGVPHALRQAMLLTMRHWHDGETGTPVAAEALMARFRSGSVAA